MTTPQEDLETLRFLAGSHREEFERRRAYEWRITLTVLTLFMVVAGMRLHAQTASQMKVLPSVLVCIGFLSIWFMGAMFLGYIHSLHCYNKIVAHLAEKAIQKCMNGESYKPLDLYSHFPSWAIWKNTELVKSGDFWIWIYQSILSLMLAVIASLIVIS